MEGDARLTLAATPDASFDLIILDAYASDAVPVHLLTREAVALFRRKLAPGGVLAFHISNRHLDLEPVLSGLARDAGWLSLVRADPIHSDPAGPSTAPTSPYVPAAGAVSSRWAVLGPLDPTTGVTGVMRTLAADRSWTAARTAPNLPVWSDTFAPVARIVRWG